MKHYFTNEDSKSDEREFSVDILGRTFKFITDIGVFSKGELDDASRFLIETFLSTTNITGDILDVGCGYGAIGVTVAKTVDKFAVHMIDVNLRAINLAMRNGELNGVNNIKVYESNCYESVEQKFGHIISNPPIRAGKKVVHQILEESINYLEEGGTLTIVIGKQHGAASAMKKMEEVFSNCERIDRKKGFWILQSIKKTEDATG